VSLPEGGNAARIGRIRVVRERWLSRRAVTLHLAVIVWVPGCLFAGWWQVTRALDGNGLSYLYSVEWPVLALVGVWVWWSLLHTDPESVGARAQRRIADAQAAAGKVPQAPPRRRDEEDEELAAYNDRLAALAADGRAKTWRSRS
jgi:DNA-binding transcriptional regulator of glucitol operon